jgi:hypothetical protein
MKRSSLVVAGLVLVLIVGFLMLVSSQDRSQEARVAKDRARDVARFLPQNSLDISMAMGMITHDPPSMLNPPNPGPPLLLYPPSAETLASLSGV